MNEPIGPDTRRSGGATLTPEKAQQELRRSISDYEADERVCSLERSFTNFELANDSEDVPTGRLGNEDSVYDMVAARIAEENAHYK